MAEPLKNMYNPGFFEQFNKTVKQQIPQFNEQLFINQIFDMHWEKKELKQRMRHVATILKDHLPGNFKQNVNDILLLINRLNDKGIKGGFEYIFFADFIEQYGLEDLKTSLKAIEEITKFISCEFAIRPFLIKYPVEVMKQMLKWSLHSHPHVRRFSSEGCRPRLPWAMGIPFLKKDPSPILPILENLKNDGSLFVRKSVANNLNDIAKDHSEIVIDIARKWKGNSPGSKDKVHNGTKAGTGPGSKNKLQVVTQAGTSPETDWIIRHGCRTLLKKADKNIYKIFGLNADSNCEIKDLKLSKGKLKTGERLGFSFNLKNISKQESKLRIEYAIYFVKANGKQSRKIFQLRENQFKPYQLYSFSKHQDFKDLTTRTHYPGKHKIGIIVNGKEMASREFVLVK